MLLTVTYVATHTMLFYIKNNFILYILNSITVLTNIVLITSQNHLSIAQASSSFKHLDMYTIMYAKPTLIAEVFYFVTRVQLRLITVTVN